MELYYVGVEMPCSLEFLKENFAANAFKTNAKMDKNGDGIASMWCWKAKQDIRIPS